jgi:surfactin synthase thioesterase subunit/acyl carrier protein
VNWFEFDGCYSRQFVQLPTYPWQRQRYWFDSKNQRLKLSPKENDWSELFNLLHQKKIEVLASQLATLEVLSEEEVKLLPKVLELLANQHKKQLQELSLIDHYQAKQPIEESGDVETAWKVAKLNHQRDEIIAARPEQRRKLLENYFSQLLSKVMGISATDLDSKQHLENLGMDSLMAAELRKQLETDFEIEVPVEFFGNLNIEQFLTQVLLLIDKKYPTEKLEKSKVKNTALDLQITSSNLNSTSEAKLWLPLVTTKPQVRFRIFCLPYAGAGISYFRSWLEEPLPEIEICPIRLPGRESRLGEAALTRLKPLVATLTPILKPYLDKPFAFFGHSMGALLSFELTRELRRRDWPCPVHLFVSGSRAPQLPDPEPPIHRLPEPKFIEKLKQLKGIPEEIMEDSEMMKLFLPALRADFALLETYFYVKDKPFDFPITAFGGLQDSKVSQEELAAWQEQSLGQFTLQMFSGDHFFLHHQQKPIVQTIIEQTDKLSILR